MHRRVKFGRGMGVLLCPNTHPREGGKRLGDVRFIPSHSGAGATVRHVEGVIESLAAA